MTVVTYGVWNLEDSKNAREKVKDHAARSQAEKVVDVTLKSSEDSRMGQAINKRQYIANCSS